MAHYKNFKVAVYLRMYEVQMMMDKAWLDESWRIVSSQLNVDKVYIETQRDRIVPTDKHLTFLKAYFADRGIETAAGTALVANERNRFEIFCYTDDSDREFVKRHIEQTARHFDELILDDFFFTNTKKDSDIAAKGDRSWTQFRMELMQDVARNIIIGPARAINPNIKLVIKYPNWYEHFQGLGFDLESGPKMFDGIYAGTETRQPKYNAQHLQQYLSYGIIRYFDDLSGGRNGGGWVDTGGMDVLDRYAEQLWLTMFGKTQEITLFDIRQLLYKIEPKHRAKWQGNEVAGGVGQGLDFDSISALFTNSDSAFDPEFTVASAAQHALAPLDMFLGELGKPIGVGAYKPFQTSSEDFLHHYFGMIGIPIEMQAEVPMDSPVVFLTEAASNDPSIVEKMKTLLSAGKRVVITSGLLQKLQGNGIEEIVEARVNGHKVLTDEFFSRGNVWKSDGEVLLPQIDYLTNDSWILIGASGNGYPLVLQAAYSEGLLDIVAVPDNPADLYKLPLEALDIIRQELTVRMPVRLVGPSEICLFVYDSDHVIVESFVDESVSCSLVLAGHSQVRDVVTGHVHGGKITASVGANETRIELILRPHTYSVFKLEY